jgi:hypothetical protein
MAILLVLNVLAMSDLTKWSEGSEAWPDQACNPTNSFGGCNTNAQDMVLVLSAHIVKLACQTITARDFALCAVVHRYLQQHLSCH